MITAHPLLEDLLADRDGALRHHDARIRRRLAGHGTSVDVGGTPATRWALDPVPVVVDAATWDRIGAAGAQRARLWDAVLADLFGPQRLLRTGEVPVDAVLAHPGYLRPCVGIEPPRPLVTAAVDVAMTRDGCVVLADRTEAPSGAGYALENRSIIAATHRDLLHRSGAAGLGEWFTTLRATLARVAPPGVEDPRVVILSPGPSSDTSFEHSYLARTLGFTLVEPADLTVRDGSVWLKSVSGPEPVHVILRRVDAAWCDPLELRSDSVLGVAGLVEAARRGTVSVVNPLGSGLAENQALFAAADRLCRTVLGEEPLLPTVPTWWCGDPIALDHVLANLDRMVVKPIARGAGRQSRFGRLLSRQAREELQGRIRARPHQFVAQEEVDLGTTPSYADGAVVERHAVLRAFLVWDGAGYRWMDGGLTRVASRPELVTMSSGGTAQDTWVVGATRHASWAPGAPLPQVDLRDSLTSRAAEAMFWLGRNLERADTVLRTVRAVAHRDDQWPDLRHEAGGAWWSTVLTTVADLAGTPTAGPDPLDAALRDPDAPRSVVTSIHFLVAGARTVRELFSLDTWRVLGEIGDAHLRLAVAADREVRDAASSLLTPLHALSGLLSESMVRDPGWRFLDLGRRIERALLAITTLRTALATEPDPLVGGILLETVLAACDSLVAYRRRHRSDIGPIELVDLLVADASNPRAVAHQVACIATDLAALPDRPPGLGIEPVRVAGAPWELAEPLEHIAGDLRAVARTLELHYFAQIRATTVGA